MIKIEELSVGNLVQANNRAYKVLAITDVVKISRGEDKDWVNVNIEDLQPLPITPENLTLIGGVLHFGEWWLGHYKARLHQDRVVIDIAEGYSQSFRSIHKLQNWLNL